MKKRIMLSLIVTVILLFAPVFMVRFDTIKSTNCKANNNEIRQYSGINNENIDNEANFNGVEDDE